MDPRATFQALIDRYLAAYAAQDAPACAALFAADGEILSPFGPPARGQAAIEAEHRRWFADGETGKTMAVTAAGIDGDLGYCLVHFEADLPGPHGTAQRFRGNSLNVMERRSDGLWTIKLTSLNELAEQEMEPDP